MHKGKYAFAQLLDFIDKNVFLRLANKYDHRLLYDGYSAEKDEHWTLYLRDAADVSISLTDTTNIKDLFAKPNYNIVNELDGSTEPSMF